MSVDVKYRTTATARGGRDGVARTEDGTFEVKLATPKELGGAGGEGNNPEQLFAAGYAACFIGAMKVAAAGQKLRVSPEATVTATVGIGPRSEGGYARASHQSADHALQLRPGSGAAGCATPLCEASLFVSRARGLAWHAIQPHCTRVAPYLIAAMTGCAWGAHPVGCSIEWLRFEPRVNALDQQRPSPGRAAGMRRSCPRTPRRRPCPAAGG